VPNDAPRDWDKELAEIDKLIAAGAGDAPPPAMPTARGRAPAAAGAGAAATPRGLAPAGGRAALATWARLLLGILLGAAMTQWPYVHGCGLPLAAYLLGVMAVMVASGWSLVASWRARAALAHALALGLLLWGLALAAREVLPRVGYAAQTAGWVCASSSTPTTPTTP
jgi:hypothetical protein